MRLEQSFEVSVQVQQAWSVLLDLERIAPCLPGATLTSFDGTGFTGNVKVKLGPVSLAYKGSGRFTERDEEARRISFVAQGQDNRGAGGASARVTAVLHPADGGQATLVQVVADIDIAGRAAQFGRGMIADVSGKLIKQFADCLAQTIAASAPAAAVASSAAAAAPPPFAVPTPPPPPPVDGVPPRVPPPLTPVFTEPAAQPATVAPPPVAEPAADYTPPATTNSAPPEYHPLAMQEPPADAAAYAPALAPTPPDVPAPEPASKPESTYAYAPEPPPSGPPVPTQTPAAASASQASAPQAAAPQATSAQPVEPAASARPAPREAEPIDLLAVSGAKGMLRRAAPVLVIVALALIGLVVWLAVK